MTEHVTKVFLTVTEKSERDGGGVTCQPLFHNVPWNSKTGLAKTYIMRLFTVHAIGL